MSKAVIQHVLDFLAVGERVLNRPNFDRALLGLASTIQPRNITFEEKTFTYRRTVDPSLYTLRNDRMSLSTYVSLIDIVTTANIIAVSYRKSTKAGVSVLLEAERAPMGDKLPPPKEVDIVSSVSKIGRTLAFCRAEVRSVDSGDLLCSGRHIKYLPTGSVIVDLATSSWFWPLTKWYFLTQRPEPAMEDKVEGLKDIVFSGLEHRGIGSALFTVQSKHTNGFGFFHGGCQATAMEVVGETLAKQELRAEKVALESMHVHYHSSGRDTVEISSETISPAQNGRVSLLVKITRNSRPISEATLQFSKLS